MRRRTNIQRLRKEHGLSCNALAEMTDEYLPGATMTQSWLSRLENGHHEPRLGTAYAIACALGVSIEEAFALRPQRARIVPIGKETKAA